MRRNATGLAACTAAIMTLLMMTGCVQGPPSLPPLSPADAGEYEEAPAWDKSSMGASKTPLAALGTRQTSEQIDRAFRGRVLRGCYPNGQKFAETLADDGRFFDTMQDNIELGTWSVTNAQLCFRYTERAAQGLADSCFIVMKSSNAYDFYTADMTSKVASTDCS